jgi:hypothetical protein
MKRVFLTNPELSSSDIIITTIIIIIIIALRDSLNKENELSDFNTTRS